MSRRIRRLHTGLFECDECSARYEVEDVPEESLYCECGADLVPILVDAEDEQPEDSE